MATNVRRLANHESLDKDDHFFEGTISRLDALQAIILNVKLKHLTAGTMKRIANIRLYKDNLKDVRSISLPIVRQSTVHTFHLFVILAKDRDELKVFPEEKGVQTLVYYPKALPFEHACSYLKHLKVISGIGRFTEIPYILNLQKNRLIMFVV